MTPRLDASHQGVRAGLTRRIQSVFAIARLTANYWIVGTEVKVPKGLNRKPSPAIPPALWNCTIPRKPVVAENWLGRTKAA